jgi:hypothetical protein
MQRFPCPNELSEVYWGTPRDFVSLVAMLTSG